MKIRTILCLPLLLIASALQAEQPQLEALEARATDTADGLVLSILGRNFDNGNILEVRLARGWTGSVGWPPRSAVVGPHLAGLSSRRRFRS